MRPRQRCELVFRTASQEAAMGRLIYAAITSLDGYIEDASGRFDWAMPDIEVHSFFNSLEANTGTQLLGRRMYETLATWQTVGGIPEVSAEEAEYADVWRSLDKIVFSRTLKAVSTPRTELRHDFDAAEIMRLKESSAKDISISGPDLAQHAFDAGLVDEVHVIVVPVIVGNGKRGLPSEVFAQLELLDVRRFGNGTVHLHYLIG